MALERRFHSFSTQYQTTRSGWGKCMVKPYCKWPVIVGIVIAVLVFFLAAFCCFRCCFRRRRGGNTRNRNRHNTVSMFSPAPYLGGYQQAHNPGNNAPPPYGEPARFAQYDHPSKKTTADSLPAMPSWGDAQTRKVEDHGDDVEMGKLDPASEKGHKPMNSIGANNSSVNLLPQNPNSHYPEADSHPVAGPYDAAPSQNNNNTQLSPHYTGPDFGHGAGHPYTGPDFSQKTSYAAYAPSESTRYEPSGANEPQELGTTYSNAIPPPSPSAQHGFQGQQQAPSVLQAGRRQEGKGTGTGNSWRDV